jgi:[acyl-carrier-protein] S-malonyltransferase
MKKFAFLFPGQGAQYPGMGKDFAETFPIARQTFEEADDLLSESLSKIIFEGSEAELTQTQYSQPAIFIVSTAILRVLKAQNPSLRPFVCAGLSLGEYTALAASMHLSFKETLLLIRKRALLMNEACEKVPGAMAAVLGLEAEKIDAALRGMEGVWVANYNCPGQIVISGTQQGIELASVALKGVGAKRVVPLQVHGAFHSGLMQTAQTGLTPFLEKAPLQTSPVRLVMNVTGDFAKTTEEIRQNLILQVTHSVKWAPGIQAMQSAGIEGYLEIGCGKTLTNFNKKIGVQAPTYSIDVLADLDVTLQALETSSCTCC